MPSKPILSTPAFSEMSAPSDGKRMGVVTRRIAARNTALKMPSMTLSNIATLHGCHGVSAFVDIGAFLSLLEERYKRFGCD